MKTDALRPTVASPEAALVIALAAGNAEGVRRALRATPDWGRVGELAALHQVDALCWWAWRNVTQDGASTGLPRPLRDRLRTAYLHHSLRNEALVEDLASLREALAARGVDALCFKGPWMAFRAYPDPGTRPVGDVDLGVREEQYHDAVAALEAAGWKPREPLPQTSREALVESHYRRQLRFSARGRRAVELHFRLVNVGPPGNGEEWLWESARDLRIGRCLLRVPGPEAMLLHLLLHANQHGFTLLRLLHDVRWALERDRGDPDAVALRRLAGRFRCRAACYHALKLAAELAGAEVDRPMLDALRPSAPRRRLFALVWRLDAVRRLEASGRHMATEAPFFYLFEMGRLRDKAVFLSGVLRAAGGPRGLLRELRRLSSAPPRGRGGEKKVRLAKRPRLRDGLILRRTRQDFALYDPVTDRTALLNPSASAVLDLCDGRRTVGEVAADVAALFGEEARDARAHVETTLTELTVQGFFDPARD